MKRLSFIFFLFIVYLKLGKKFSAPRILKMYHTLPPSVNFIISKANHNDLFIDKNLLKIIPYPIRENDIRYR